MEKEFEELRALIEHKIRGLIEDHPLTRRLPEVAIRNMALGEREMKAKIEVENRKEAELIRRGLADPGTRALVKIMGAMSGLTKRQQIRSLRFVGDCFDDQQSANQT